MEQPLWYNPLIKIDRKTVFLNQWYDNGITCIGDVLNEDGTILTYDEFTEKYFTPQFTVFYGLRNQLISTWPQLRNFNNKLHLPMFPLELKIILKSKKGSQDIYQTLNKNLEYSQKCRDRWTVELNKTFDLEEWEHINAGNFRCTMDIRLRWFQYRIVNRIIATNKFLEKNKKRQDSKCSFCNEGIETLAHLFFDCPMVLPIWEELRFWIFEKTNFNIIFSKEKIILGFNQKGEEVFNLLIILAKRYIYTQRIKNARPRILGVKAVLENYFNTEKFIYRKNNDYASFLRRWNIWTRLFGTDF